MADLHYRLVVPIAAPDDFLKDKQNELWVQINKKIIVSLNKNGPVV